jgi:hypothetical protein
MGQSSSKKKYLVEEEDTFLEVSKQMPYEEWLEYLKKWIVLDSKKDTIQMIDLIENDLKNGTTNNYNSFIRRYESFEPKLGSLGKCALEVTKTNFMLWDMGMAPSIHV